MTVRRLGYVFDVEDARDWSFSDHLLALGATADPPLKATIRPLLGAPLDQGPIGSCVAHAVAKAIQASHRKQGNLTPELLSRLALYYLARATHQAQRYDSGTFLRAAFQVLNKLGFCAERLWPYDPEKFAVQPPTKAFRLAHDQRAPTLYWRIKTVGAARQAEIMRAISRGYAVVFGMQVSRRFVNGDFIPTVPQDVDEGEIAGGHAMVIAGYDLTGGQGYDVLSSWGSGWGDHGFCNVTWSAINNRARDVWVVEKAPLVSS